MSWLNLHLFPKRQNPVEAMLRHKILLTEVVVVEGREGFIWDRREDIEILFNSKEANIVTV